MDNLKGEILLNNMIKVSNNVRIDRHIKTDKTGNKNSSHIFENIEDDVDSFRNPLIFGHKKDIIKIRSGLRSVRAETRIRDLKQDNTN